MSKPKKVIILGSGAIKIGQAGEFDYSGSQAIKALKEEGVKTILVNPNIATIQTSEYLADEVYFIPVNPEEVARIIKKEKPDGILLSFGGQTSLNCGLELAKMGVLKKHHVKVLGTGVRTIEITEDRRLFVKKLHEINVRTPKSYAVTSISEAAVAAKKLGYPVMLRAAYALGGLGSGPCHSEKELKEKAHQALSQAPQLLIEEYLKGWKEIEYEVVRDSSDNCLTVCNMENFDPMGIHTGESIVVAPSQTLSNSEYHKLREISIKVIRHLGVVGECNIQYALNPFAEDYRVIEVNARLSRSSALASKATGYPLAFVATKIALGYSLSQIDNSITKVTKACFEPALDYLVVKVPRWDLQKFKMVQKEIGSEMKSIGEVMAIGRNFEEAIQKALRMIDTGMNGLVANDMKLTGKEVEKELREPTDKRVFVIAEALKRGFSVEKIYQLSKIDQWFIYKIKNVVEIEKELRGLKKLKNLTADVLKGAKQKGFSDKQIAVILNVEEQAIRHLRKKFKLNPVVKQIDTLAAEYPAKTNYLYLTYNGQENDLKLSAKKQIMLLGSGAYRIGSSVEFDWCGVNAVLALRKLGYKTIMLNCNPETVSTDYDICDNLIFDEISLEVILDIYDKSSSEGVIISMGGQTPNNLALKLHQANVKILGTSPVFIDRAENRHKFSSLLDRLNISQPEWQELTDISEAKKFAKKVGYPVLIRPSYVLSGAAMYVALNEQSLGSYLKMFSRVSSAYPVVISKFITGAKEVEIDAVANKGKLVCWAISEHVENAGVHSGDATIILPPQRLYLETTRKIKMVAKEIASALQITGPFNIQFIAKNNQIKVIECNLRASRSFPFVSKIFKLNFIELAIKAIMNKEIKPIEKSTFELDYVGVKAPQFSFVRLKGSDPTLSVDMTSTGEVACFGDDVYEAFLKAFLSVGYNIPKKNILLSTGSPEDKAQLLNSCRLLSQLGYKLYGTCGTCEFLKENEIKAVSLNWPSVSARPNVADFIKNKKIDLVINIPKEFTKTELANDYEIRRLAVDYNVPLITNVQIAQLFIRAIYEYRHKALPIKSWNDYGRYPYN